MQKHLSAGRKILLGLTLSSTAMALRLFDSLSRELRELKPSQPDGVYRFYNCGPTVYAPAHIGNFRTFVVNDVLRRVLELQHGAEKVKHVRNLTDVDDRTIGRPRKKSARSQKSPRSGRTSFMRTATR
jgi:cysteinyl-tRNA synthetase